MLNAGVPLGLLLSSSMRHVLCYHDWLGGTSAFLYVLGTVFLSPLTVLARCCIRLFVFVSVSVIFAAVLCISVAYNIIRCLSVCPSVHHVRVFRRIKKLSILLCVKWFVLYVMFSSHGLFWPQWKLFVSLTDTVCNARFAGYYLVCPVDDASLQ